MGRAKGIEQRAKGKGCIFFSMFYALCSLLYVLSVKDGFCDILRLKEIAEDKEGHEIEILEERKDSFIIKLPKSEIKKIRRKRPTDVELWREKSIVWEDSGDYIVIYLPKEKVVLPEGYEGDEYDSAQVFIEAGLSAAGREGRPPQEAGYLGAAGRIVGQVMLRGQGKSGVKIKIVNVSYQENLASRLFGPKVSRPEDLVIETETDEYGIFEFKAIPIGEYDLYWRLSGSSSWYRRLSEKPEITVRPGETTEYPDIKIK